MNQHTRTCSLVAGRLVAVVALAVALPAAAPAGDTLADRIEAVIDGPDFKHALWGVQIADLQSGETLYERNADKLFAPASTTKLYSVATALATLGADYRFETPIHARGQVDDRGQLHGDLILVASGDLSLQGRTDAHGRIAFADSDHTYAGFGDASELTAPDPLAGLAELARQVAAAGITRVRGEVLVDDRLFDPAVGTGSGPTRLTPIMVNDNLVDILVTPTSAGSPAQVAWRPETSAYQLDAQVATVAADAATRLELTAPAGTRIVVRGEIPAGRKPLLTVYEVADAAGFARALLIESLRRTGVQADASPLAANRPELLPPRDGYGQLRRVALLTSPPFAESARLILKVSHNLHASTLPLLVAAKHGQRTLAEGLRRQRDFLAAAGVEVDTISFGGGAGGDRADYVTPRATVALLRHMATRGDFAAYEAALPLLGVDGTLARAVPPESPARGKVRAKTGTLLFANVMNDRQLLTSKALAGYAETSGGRRLALAMFVNHVHLQKPADRERIGQVLGKLCEILYESP